MASRVWCFTVEDRIGMKYRSIYTVLIISFLVRFLLSPLRGHPIDTGTFSAWWDAAATHGIFRFYESTSFCDYPPLNVYLFWSFGSIAKILSISWSNPFFPYLLKMPQNLFDLLAAYLIYRVVKTDVDDRWALISAGVYAFNPATIFNSSVWGQVDAIYTFFILLSLVLVLRDMPELSFISLTLGVLLKPQAVALLPVVAFVTLKRERIRLFTSTAISILLALIVAFPFSHGNPVGFLYDLYTSTYGGYPYNSVNAYNLWAIMGLWKTDSQTFLGMSLHAWGLAMFGALVAYVILLLNSKMDDSTIVYSAFLLLFGFFMLPTRIHERYLFPLFAILALTIKDKKTRWIYGILTVTYLINLFYVLSFALAERYQIPNDELSLLVLAPINTLVFLYSLVLPIKGLRITRHNIFEKLRVFVGRNREKIAVTTITLAFFVASVYNLGSHEIPTSSWRPTELDDGFYADLGSTSYIRWVSVLVKDGDLNLHIYCRGENGEWESKVNEEIGGYYRWNSYEVGCSARYVNLTFTRFGGELAEVGIFDGDGERYGVEVVGSQGATRLFDEQGMLEGPPTYMMGTYFDEIYYVPAAVDHLNLRESSQWDHPPMGKLIMAVGIAVFGFNPFGWRIMGVLFSTLMIPIIYFFARKMYGTFFAALVSSILLGLDFMRFTMGRMATVDTYVVFFTLLTYLFFYLYLTENRWRNQYFILMVLSFSLGFSTKWLVAFGFLGVLFLLAPKVRERVASREVRLKYYHLIPIVAIPALVYLLSYVPYVLAGHDLVDVVDLQFSMFRFHSGLEATHPFSSHWWTWPFIQRPVWLFVVYLPHNLVSTIASMGNPAVWWVGFICVFFCLFRSLKDKTCLFLTTIFFFQWLPYVLIGRLTFIYHFYSNVPIIVLMITYWLQMVRRVDGRLVLLYIGAVAALFIIFHPVISGFPVSVGYRDMLRWMDSWIF